MPTSDGRSPLWLLTDEVADVPGWPEVCSWQHRTQSVTPLPGSDASQNVLACTLDRVAEGERARDRLVGSLPSESLAFRASAMRDAPQAIRHREPWRYGEPWQYLGR